jgi:23S rRNA (uracil1939-C5)-methyltransferase
MSDAPPLVRLRVRVEDVVYPGKALARHEGKALFTDEGLPGELVEVDVLKERTGFIEARTVDVLEPSPRRRGPRCEHYWACSPYQVIEDGFQLDLKRRQLEGILGRRLGSAAPGVEVRPSPKTWGYRNRVRFHLLGRPGSLSLAYNSPGSDRDFVPVTFCHLVSDQMGAVLTSALEILNRARTSGVEDIEVRETASGSEVLLSLAGGKFESGRLPRALGPELRRQFPLSGMVWLAKGRSGTQEAIVFGRDFLEETAGGMVYRLGARSFFQVNRFLFEAALETARGLAAGLEKGRVADLYCGVGTFGLALAAGASQVEGVESDPANLAFLARNVRANGASNFLVRAGTAEDWIGKVLAGKPDLVVLDPPRKGLGPRITGPLLAAPPARVLYLSCDPSTLVRDLVPLVTRFDLRRVTLFDFFPQTPHIESLCWLERR